MALFEKRQQLNQGGIGKPTGPMRPEKMPSPKEQPKDSSIFGGKPSIPMSEFKWRTKQSSSVIPGTGGKMFTGEEKRELIDKATKKYGSFLGRDEVSKIFKDLKKERASAQTDAERLKIDRQIRYFEQKGIFGK